MLSIMAGSGCDGLGAPEREEARVVVTAEQQEDVPVEVITSTRFNVGNLGSDTAAVQVSLLTADTAVRLLPYEDRFGIEETRRFYILVSATDSTPAVTARMEVFIDGERQASLVAELQNQPLQNIFISR